MSNNRKPLVEQLKEAIEFFSKRKTVGIMKTEHSVFIPSEMIVYSSKEVEEFIRAARRINENSHLGCPVIAEEVNLGVQGIEFVFQFSEETKFTDIIRELDSSDN